MSKQVSELKFTRKRNITEQITALVTNEKFHGAIITYMQSPLGIALAAQAATIVQWNLEHLSINPKIRQIEYYETIPYRGPLAGSTVNSSVAALAAVAAGGMVNTQNNTITVKRIRYVYEGMEIKRLTSEDTSKLNDKTIMPLAAPILSTAFRLADAGADTAVAALALAQTNIQNAQAGAKGGLVGQGLSFLFGSGK